MKLRLGGTLGATLIETDHIETVFITVDNVLIRFVSGQELRVACSNHPREGTSETWSGDTDSLLKAIEGETQPEVIYVLREESIPYKSS